MTTTEPPSTAPGAENLESLWAEFRRGNPVVQERLLTAYYQELRAIARRILRADAGSRWLQPTELTNEAAIRLLGLERMEWRDRTHFLATAATVMRQVLIDEVRRAKSLKRGGREVHTRLTSAGDLVAESQDDAVEIESLDAALTALQMISPERARIVEMRYFAGLTIEEIAGYLDVSDRTIKRQWRAARAWLLDHITAARA